MTNKFDLQKIRKDFPQLQSSMNNNPLIYLDNAATTLKPLAVINSITNYYSFEVANVHRGVHLLSETGTVRYEETREKIKSFINSKSLNEIIFTKGTTDSINLLAATFCQKFLKKDDVILVSTMDHHSNIVPWQIEASKVQAQVINIPILNDGTIDLLAYQNLLKKYSVKMVSVCHISNTLGTINPIDEMIKMAHLSGAYFCVDAAQSALHEKIDVQSIDCDFLAFSAHKMLGPNGVGILYGKEDLLNSLPPYQGGGAMITQVSFSRSEFHKAPLRFEAGTPTIAEVIAFKAAIEYIESIGVDQIKKYELELTNYLSQKLLEIENLKLIGTAKNKTSVVSFDIQNIHPQDIGTILSKYGVAIRTGHHCTMPLLKFFNVAFLNRASICFYNSKEEIDQFTDYLKRSLKFLI